MTSPDPHAEASRLANAYREMADAELEQLANDPAALTAVAFRSLNAELRRRGLPAMQEPGRDASPSREIPPGPVAVLRFRDLPDAEMAQSVLRSAGIDSFLADQNTIRLHWFWSNAIGGVKVVVRAEDEADARELLNQAGSGLPES